MFGKLLSEEEAERGDGGTRLIIIIPLLMLILTDSLFAVPSDDTGVGYPGCRLVAFEQRQQASAKLNSSAVQG